MKWVEVSSVDVEYIPERFCDAVMVWIKRPNVCNKILSCSVVTNLESQNGSMQSLLPKETMEYAAHLFQLYWNKSKLASPGVCKHEFHYILRKLVPKHPDQYKCCFELVIKEQSSFMFLPLSHVDMSPHTKDVAYILQLQNNLQFDDETNSSKFCASCLYRVDPVQTAEPAQFCDTGQRNCFANKEWIQKVLVPTLYKWLKNDTSKGGSKFRQSIPHSHSLIDSERYSLLYSTLKRKYGTQLAKAWPEVTDPQKYVYEDVAIAAYLLILWEQERKANSLQSLQSFIDIGCGNGLLVHILNSEGHPGKGVDLRRRKIWDMYPSSTKLQETTVTPESLELIQAYDWLLGNHSDELTPWITIMAARSENNARFWILPCCFFDLYGKYERKQSKCSQYEEYLDYIKSIGDLCGFHIDMDVMRIPSTKRICLVGSKPAVIRSDRSKVLENIEQFIKENSEKATRSTFQSRPKVQKVNNCTKIDRDVQNYIVRKLVSRLLEVDNFKSTDSGKLWNLGGIIPLSEAILLFDQSTTAVLKRECGGLQTLLRNHHQIFHISQSCVQLRDWTVVEQKRKKTSSVNIACMKTKLCWFYGHHPGGCPRNTENCPFAHGDNDLRQIK